jgi:hypothetical protein
MCGRSASWLGGCSTGEDPDDGEMLSVLIDDCVRERRWREILKSWLASFLTAS